MPYLEILKFPDGLWHRWDFPLYERRTPCNQSIAHTPHTREKIGCEARATIPDPPPNEMCPVCFPWLHKRPNHER